MTESNIIDFDSWRYQKAVDYVRYYLGTKKVEEMTDELMEKLNYTKQQALFCYTACLTGKEVNYMMILGAFTPDIVRAMAIGILGYLALTFFVIYVDSKRTKHSDTTDDDPFIDLYTDSEKKIVYDRNTKVKYLIIDETSVTPLYNPDGSLQIYNKSEEGDNVHD